MSDGRLWFNTKIDNSQVDKDLKELERKIQKSEETISNSENAKLPYVKQAEELNKKLAEAKQNLKIIKSEMTGAQSAMAPGASAEDRTRAAADLPALKQAVRDQEKEVAALQKQWDAADAKVRKYDDAILQANADIDRSKAKVAELKGQQATSSQIKTAQAMERANKTAARFGRRLWEIGKSALIFNLISAGLRSVVKYMGTALKSNSEYTQQLAQLKGALLTAFQPIYEFVLPGVIAVLKVLTAIAQVFANVLSFFSGKTEDQSAKNAKALNDEAKAIKGVGGAAKEAKKQLLGFDEINKLDSQESGGVGGGSSAGGITPDFSGFDTAEYKAKIDELTVYLSGALLALGAILAFSGVNIPLGIGLMAAGALGLVAVVSENWGAMTPEIQGALGSVAAVLGGAALAVGAILAFSGINIPLGIALMAVGAASLVTAGKLGWDNIANTLRGSVGTVVAIASGALLALGLILAFSGLNLPLGIALIAAGAAGLVTVGALNWNTILEKCKGVWSSIQQWFNANVAPKLTLTYWKEKFSSIAEGLKLKIKDGVNNGIALFNSFISWINSALHLSWEGLSAFGQTIIPPGSYQLLTIPHIPYLAQGAVIPPNAPFLAMLGDQRSGTNIEAPLETIKQALAEVMAQQGWDVSVRFTGDLAALARVLTPVITREQRNNERARGK